MIKNTKPLSMAEARTYLSEGHEELNAFIKGFSTIEPEKAIELRKKLLSLDIIKLNEKLISKIIDILPENKADLNDILTDVNMDENESNNILQTIKEYK